MTSAKWEQRRCELIEEGKALHSRLDADLVAALLASSDHREGSMFQGWHNESGYHEQLGFLKRVFEEVKPRKILETGTHKANFCYLAKVVLPDVRIVTFGIDDVSQSAVDILNGHCGDFVEFILGDTRRTLPMYDGGDFDLAWIDGGHRFDVCASDLEQCARIGIRQLCVDDHRLDTVQAAVDEFCARWGFVVVEKTMDEREIVRLSRSSWRSPRLERA